MTEKALQVAEGNMANIEDMAMSIEGVIKQAALIKTVLDKVMQKDVHYGVIPGTGTKPTLLKPGAEKICTTFRLAPAYEIKRTDMADGHREYEIVCTLTHIPTGQIFGQGVGSCSSMESKYRFRKAEQTCPECGENTIIKGKQEYGGGWLCFKKKGGCGTKFKDGDPVIENQEMGRVEYDNPADYYNTVLKMGKKRAHVDAVLTATAASDIFTQDVEDMPKGKPDNGDSDRSEPDEYNRPGKADIEHVKGLWITSGNFGWTEAEARNWLVKKYDIKSSKDLTSAQVNEAVKYFKDNPKAKTEPPDSKPTEEDWFPNDELQAIFEVHDIALKAGGDKIRQYMATNFGLTGQEVEAKLVRLGIYKSAGAWKTLSDKVFIPGEEL